MTIFCQAIENELIQLGHELSRAQWKIGYIVKAAIDRAEADRMTIYSDAAKLTGKSSRSIRRFYAVAAYYSPEQYQAYNVLSFEHFAVAMSYGPRSLELLDACLGQMEHNGGGVPSVDWMEAYAAPGVITAYEVDLAGEFTDPTPPDDLSQPPEPDNPGEDSPVLTQAAARAAVSHLQTHHKAIVNIVNAISLEGDCLTRFIAASDQMQAAIYEIAQTIILEQAPR